MRFMTPGMRITLSLQGKYTILQSTRMKTEKSEKRFFRQLSFHIIGLTKY